MFEVFWTGDGRTICYCLTEQEANAFCDKTRGTDYLPAEPGFYVLGNGVPMVRDFSTMAEAGAYCDFNNMGSDTVTYTFIHWEG